MMMAVLRTGGFILPTWPILSCDLQLLHADVLRDMPVEWRIDVTMVKEDQRLCDTCGDVIPRGVAYRVGYTTPDAVESWFEDEPEFLPTFTEEPDGIVRFDLCLGCAGESESLQTNSEPVVDLLH